MIRALLLGFFGVFVLAGAIIPFVSRQHTPSLVTDVLNSQMAAQAAANAAGAGASAEDQAIATYLRKNPEIVVEALKLYQNRQEAQRRSQVENVFVNGLDKFMHDGGVHAAGPADAKVTMIEFFDYNCGYCRHGLDTVLSILKDNKDVRVLFVEFPILSSESEIAARASLAADKQGKYVEYHTALMRTDGRVTVDSIFSTARDVGLDVDRLQQDMNSSEINARIAFNRQIAAALEIQSTPTFFVSTGKMGHGQLIAGFSDDGELERAVADARKLARRG